MSTVEVDVLVVAVSVLVSAAVLAIGFGLPPPPSPLWPRIHHDPGYDAIGAWMVHQARCDICRGSDSLCDEGTSLVDEMDRTRGPS